MFGLERPLPPLQGTTRWSPQVLDPLPSASCASSILAALFARLFVDVELWLFETALRMHLVSHRRPLQKYIDCAQVTAFTQLRFTNQCFLCRFFSRPRNRSSGLYSNSRSARQQHTAEDLIGEQHLFVHCGANFPRLWGSTESVAVPGTDS